jgi:hypothetical protein
MTNLWVRIVFQALLCTYFVILRNEASLFIECLLRFFLRQNDKFVSSVFPGFYYAIILSCWGTSISVIEQFAEILPSEWQFCEFVALFQAFMLVFCHAKERSISVYWAVCWDSSFRQNDKLWVLAFQASCRPYFVMLSNEALCFIEQFAEILPR